MYIDRPIVMSIAGLDPSAGAGLFADIKTFEQHKVYGLGICSAQTLQTETEFLSIRWEKAGDIVTTLEKMLMHYEVKAVKVGIVEDINVLLKVVSAIHSINKDIKIIVDPILRSSSGFTFWKDNVHESVLKEVLSKIYLLTPNYDEMGLITGEDAKASAEELSMYCNILLKGGHNKGEPAIDYLFMNGKTDKIIPEAVSFSSKHGSGCVLSSAITANLALGFDLHSACRLAKSYIERFLSSSETLLGYHHV